MKQGLQFGAETVKEPVLAVGAITGQKVDLNGLPFAFVRGISMPAVIGHFEGGHRRRTRPEFGHIVIHIIAVAQHAQATGFGLPAVIEIHENGHYLGF